LFYQALEKDKLVVDIYLQILTHAEDKLNLQSLVIRDLNDFETMLPLKNFGSFLMHTIKKPEFQNNIIKASWNLSEERILFPS